MIGIYAHIIDEEIVYIGQSIDIATRKRNHLSLLRRGVHPNNYLQNCYNRDKNIVICHPIELLEDESSLTDREIHYISLYNPKCNFAIPTKNKSYRHSEETKNKISALKKGVSLSKQHLLSLRKAHKNRKSKKVIDMSTGTEYTSAKAAAAKLGLSSYSHIIEVCAGSRKSAYGRAWRYGECL